MGVLIVSFGTASAETGLIIRGGLLHDSPKYEVFDDIEPGIGYIAGLGYNIWQNAGVGIGFMNSSHEYRFTTVGRVVRTEMAEKSSFFIRVHYMPLKTDLYGIMIGAGPTHFAINGKLETEYYGSLYPYNKRFSGWGYTADLDLMYFITENFAITFYLLANIIKYSKQSENPLNPDDFLRLPRGNSISWGMTFFYSIGKLNFN